jgi:hypothetical protein
MAGAEIDIAVLSRELAHLQRRAARQRRSVGTEQGWQRWSATMDEIARLTEVQLASPAPTIHALAAKFRAILWLIEVNESLLDTGDLRRLRRFRREIDLLANQ